MNRISLFKGFPAKGEPHRADESLSIADFLNGIKYGKWKSLVDPIRTEQDDKLRKFLKTKLPAVTIGGLFEIREQDELVEHSGFICVDIDHFNDKTALLQDKYTYALFRSVSGNGIAVIIKVNPDKHKESYDWIQSYYFASYGISVDPAPKNVASLRFVSYDEELFINERSLKSKTKSVKPKKVKTLPIVLDSGQVDQLVQEVHNSGKNIAADYAEYLKLGFAIANGFSESGREYYHAICMASDKYDSQQCDKQYTRCLKGANKSGVTVGTFYYMLKENGFQLPRGNEPAVQVAAMAKKAGRSKEAVKSQLIQLNGLEEAEAEKISSEVFQRKDINLTDVARDPEQLIPSLISWLFQNHPIRLNGITRMIEENNIEVKRERLNTIYLKARMAFNSKEVTKDLIESIIFSDNIVEFNPLTEYIDKNRNKNSTGNVDAIAKSIRTNTPNADLFIKKWLVSIIAAADGYPVRSVLALVGGQNSGKTEYFRRLLPAKIQKYYSESKLDAGKDDEMLMTQKLIVMDDEMGGKSKQDEKRFKELTSKAVFSLRAPYGRHNEDFKRLAILCGTSNDPSIINDPTGNTRILPVEVISIDHELYNSVNKDELFMELVRMYEGGFDWKLSKDELLDLNEVSSEFETIPFERELIGKFYLPKNAAGYVSNLTSSEIKDYIETNTKQRITNMRRFGIELKSFFGPTILKNKDGIRSRCYPVILKDGSNVLPESDSTTGLPF